MLVDWQIRKRCEKGRFYDPMEQYPIPIMIEPFSEGVQGNGVISYGLTHAGYDIRLAPVIYQYNKNCDENINPKRFNEEEYKKKVFITHELKEGNPFVLRPHDYILGHSVEYLRIPRDLKATCVGKSTLARSLILINTTPLEPGWEGHLTIEIGNLSPLCACIFPCEGIAQLEFHKLDSLPETDYGQKKGKYQGQLGVTPAIVE